MLNIFEKHGKANKRNYRYQFWQHENHPVLPDNYSDSYKERLNYLHRNPVRAGFVTDLDQWLYSSAIDYYTNNKGFPELVMI